MKKVQDNEQKGYTSAVHVVGTSGAGAVITRYNSIGGNGKNEK